MGCPERCRRRGRCADFPEAAALIAEGAAIAEATGIPVVPYAATFVAALRGDQAELARLIDTTVAETEARGQGAAVTCTHRAVAITNNGLGRYADALAAAELTTRDANVYISMWALPELIEAAARTGNDQVAADALYRLAETTQADGTDFGLGLEARCRALLSEGDTSDACYREALQRLERTPLRTETARAHLVYGEWPGRPPAGPRLPQRRPVSAGHRQTSLPRFRPGRWRAGVSPGFLVLRRYGWPTGRRIYESP